MERIFPDFKSEAEEAEWWDSHQDESMEAFEKAAIEGRLGRGTMARKAGLPATTIRLDPVDIELAREQAEKRGLKYQTYLIPDLPHTRPTSYSYQTYLKMVIHEALMKESKAS